MGLKQSNKTNTTNSSHSNSNFNSGNTNNKSAGGSNRINKKGNGNYKEGNKLVPIIIILIIILLIFGIGGYMFVSHMQNEKKKEILIQQQDQEQEAKQQQQQQAQQQVQEKQKASEGKYITSAGGTKVPLKGLKLTPMTLTPGQEFQKANYYITVEPSDKGAINYVMHIEYLGKYNKQTGKFDGQFSKNEIVSQELVNKYGMQGIMYFKMEWSQDQNGDVFLTDMIPSPITSSQMKQYVQKQQEAEQQVVQQFENNQQQSAQIQQDINQKQQEAIQKIDMQAQQANGQNI